MAAIAYASTAGRSERLVGGLADAARAVARGGTVWIDVEGEVAADEAEAIARLLGLAPTAFVGFLRPGGPPTAVWTGGVLHLRLRLGPGQGRDDHQPGRLEAFLTRRVVVTVHDRALPAPAEARDDDGGDRLSSLAATLAEGPDALLAELAGRVLERYFAAFEGWRRRLDRVENGMLAKGGRLDLRQAVALRHELLRLSRGLEFQREALARLGRAAEDPVGEAASRRFALLADDSLHLLALLTGGRELVQNLFDLDVALASQRTNLVMQRLTVVTTVFLPLTLITGIYGMNFDRMPELHLPWGYPAALAFMAAVGTGLYLWFRRAGWFGDG
ncbi:MAG: magnesium transporter CorA family protein [Clostridia bacterium]|nr:magnesium transporter CorA family protein [Clostridia bacterium]